MHVLGVGRHPDAMPQEHLDHAYAWDELPDVLSSADHVVLCFPATPENRNLFNAQLLQHIKRGAFFYNVGRGSVVDEEALAECLRSGQIRGAGLDVFHEEPLPAEHPFWSMESVLITPHSAGRSVREYDRICDLFVENLTRFHQGQPLLNVVRL